MFQRQRKEMSPKVKYRRWRVLKRQIQFDKVHGGRICILLLQKCGHNDRLHKIALIPPFPIVSSVVDVESNVDEKTGGRPLDGDGINAKTL